MLARPTTKDERAAMLSHVTREAEARPGVYRMLSEEGTVLYVGKSSRLRVRLLSYFRAGRRDKASRILREARAIAWTYEPSEFAALREELRLIKLYRPRLNVMSKRDAEHYAFLRVTPGPAPRLEVARRDAAGEGQYYGPFIGPSLVADAAKELSDALGLRDCSDLVTLHFRRGNQPIPEKLRAPDCIRHDVGKCLGPCVAACDRAEYTAAVDLATAFLEGRSALPIERFRREMEAAKERLAYERAALFRDRMLRLEQLRAQFTKIRFALESLSFVYPVPGHGGDDRVYLVRRGTVRAEMPEPRTTEARLALQREIDRVYSPREAPGGAVRTHEVEEILLLSSWFKSRPAELARAWRPDLS
ncbi:MAG: GIY-YIG nuclease family protein [Polyangiaceae bacterium]